MAYVVRNGKLQKKWAVYGAMTPKEAVMRNSGITFGAMSDAELERMQKWNIQKKKKKNNAYAGMKEKYKSGKATKKDIEMLWRMK